nr:uncharacterized protein LOC117858699 isoform X2 [Setaria viridis]
MAGRGSAPDRKPNCWRWRQRARTDRHGTEVSTRMQGVPPCQPGDISGGSQDAAPLFELDKLPETFNMPVLPGFLHLKRLKIYFCGTGYDYFSLVFFLEACPALETFFLSTGEYVFGRQDTIPQDFNADSLHIRRIPGFHHASLKKVSINQFFSSKSLIELTCQIVENTSSLRYLVLDTTSGFDPRGTCKGMNMHAIRKAHCAVEAVERYIVGKVPSTVKFKVLEPCSQCHVANL